ncbi:hypothetical protein HDU83_009167 [Entophlyctis luteolus]|nr:hypothetical protein HDU83_009167 [Entophlyctis luteolus]
MRVLDSVLRTADPTTVGALAKLSADLDLESFDVVNCIRMLGSWDPWPNRERGDSIVQSGRQLYPSNDEICHFQKLLKVIHQEAGPERRPPNNFPMTIYTSCPTFLKYSSSIEQTQVQAPILKETFLIKNLLSLSECQQILTAAESVGFTPDEPVVDTASNRSTLAHNVIWLIDKLLAKKIEERAWSFLPKTMCDDGDMLPGMSNAGSSLGVRVLDGINRRWRIYRYVPGAIYRPHIDGGWPKSEYNEDTQEYSFDASSGSVWSRLTFLIYLNEGFKGGETTYFVPSQEPIGVMDAKSVIPRAGCAMVFPHGNVQGNLLHEGSAVLEGVKYIARTEVLYRRQ